MKHLMKRRMKFLAQFLLLFVVAAPAWAAVAPEVGIKELASGNGEEAVPYAQVKVHYTGWTLDGKKFDSSVDRGTPFDFILGAGEVIPGWDEGVEGMRVGGKRELIIPPELAYGPEGVPGVIPVNATLKFEVELLGVAGPDFANIDNAQLKELLAKGVPIVDLRREEEWKQTGVVEGSKLITAINVKGEFLPPFIEGFKAVAGPNDEVILICRTGNRTGAVADYLVRAEGYKKIYNVRHGITQWIKDGGPVVKP
ncbi:MAG: FKBP-type peptidyl-prolyl cis-trans isomerase [Rhodospirillales bacterium]|nr:FKBP-type peptidyl-prolyl cis-trans isomerase [Rhodospirillales bacterium]